MSNQIERLKGKSIQLVMPMVKKRLSETVIEDIIAVDEKFRDAEILFQDIESKETLGALKAFLLLHKAQLGRHLYDYCAEELREMSSDLKWSRSKQGKAVLALEAWVATARQQLSASDGFESIFIGRDWNDPEVLIVSGVLNEASQQEHLKEEIRTLNPPVEPVYIIEKAASD